MSVTLKGSSYKNAFEFAPATQSPLAGGNWDGKRRVQINKHTLDSGAAADGGAFEAGSTLKVAKIPAGATLIKVSVYTDDLGSATLDAGDGTTADEYGTLDTTSAGVKEVLPLTRVTVDTDIVLTGADATATNGQVINSIVEYAVN